MKQPIIVITVCFFMALIIISCNTNSSTQNNTNKQTSEQNDKDSSITITAKYISGGSFEGDAILIFEKEDGSEIEFYRNYFNPDEPKIKYNFLSEEGVSGNPELLGSMFIIKYIKNPKGQISAVSGEAEPCNQILSVVQK